MESESLRSMTFVGLKNIRYINPQNALHVVPRHQDFLKIREKLGIVRVA